MKPSRMQRFFPHLLLVLAFAASALAARACDLCGCYTPQIEAMTQAELSASGEPMPADGGRGRWLSRVYFAIAEQFTHFGTLQFDGNEVDNPTGQYLDSSVTQLVGGYSFDSRFALQINVPLIYRSFVRPEGFAIDRGTESGLGDVSLLGKFGLFHRTAGEHSSLSFDDPKSPHFEKHEPDFTASGLLIGGMKFPTGGTRRLKEEFNEVDVPGAPQSGIHGHDLTLGTGSYDGIIGAQTSLRYKSFFFQADSQFTLRGDGAHQYNFANDISWSGGPGYYFVRNRQTIVGLQCACSGERKDVDRFRGEPAEDTGITAVFLGPRLIISSGKLGGELAAELPVSIDNTALQAVPDYRLRASFGFRF
ncbi:MAG TPA: hypothetical protein VLO30_06825 [Chthoniobacterales bacterium]|nr:hypothetical protein [Chthoniobacterales bacterium]